MIPCAVHCPHYQEGCHKTCAKWGEYVQRSKKENKAKAEWLHAHNQECFELVRTYLAISSCRSHRHSRY